jgi:transposase-like protein
MRGHKYPDDFKADALALMRRGDRSLRQVSDDLGVSHWTLRDWYRADEMARKKGKRPKHGAAPMAPLAETPEQKIERLERENARLEKKVERLEEDRAILKKAAAFFAKESE